MAQITSENIVQSSMKGYEIPNISVGEFLYAQIRPTLKNNPNRVALIDTWNDQSKRLTYDDLHQQAHAIAYSLVSPPHNPNISLHPNDVCMFFGDNCSNYVVLTWALAYLGVPSTPSKPANGVYETRQQLKDSCAQVLCVTANKLSIVEQVFQQQQQQQQQQPLPPPLSLKILLIINDTNEISTEQQRILARLSKNPLAPQCILMFNELLANGTGKQLQSIPYFPINDPFNDTHSIIYTSGSTGLPKGAQHSHSTFIASIMAMLHMNAFVHNRGGVIDFIYPLGHISGTMFVVDCLCSQMTLLLFGDQCTHENIRKALNRYNGTVMIITLAFGAELIATNTNYDDDDDRTSFRTIKSVFFSGSRLPNTIANGLITKYGFRMYEIYGATEFMGSVFNNNEEQIDPKLYCTGKIGTPLPNVEMKIIDLQSGAALPPRKEGEICFRGPQCFKRYLHNEKATHDTIDTNGWYHSGDVGYYDENGALYITDRIKELIKYKHWTVSPAEIENFLQTHPSIVGACVVGVYHRDEGQHLRAYVQLVDNGNGGGGGGGGQSDVTEQEIVDYVKANMGYQNRLNGGVRFVRTIERISMGKIDRQYYKRLVKDELLTQPAE